MGCGLLSLDLYGLIQSPFFSTHAQRALFATLGALLALAAEMWLYLKADIFFGLEEKKKAKGKKKPSAAMILEGPSHAAIEEVPLIAKPDADKKDD